MNLKRAAGALVLAVSPLVLATPALADNTGLPGSVIGDPSGTAYVEVAGAQAADPAYAARLAGWPQPNGIRVQPGMVSARALMRSDLLNGGGIAEVAGVQVAGVEVAGAQASQITDADYASRLLAYPQPAGIRIQPGMVGLHSIQRGDSLWPEEIPYGATE